MEARIACSNARLLYRLVARQSDTADMDYKEEYEQLGARVEEVMQSLDGARVTLSKPMSRLQLEELHGIVLEVSTAAKQVEASVTAAFENLIYRRPDT